MTHTQFIGSEFYNTACQFTLRDSRKIQGIISGFNIFGADPLQLFFLPMENMKKFYLYKKINSIVYMRLLLEEIEVENIVEAELLQHQATKELSFS